MALDTTVGGANSNSYATVEEANEFLGTNQLYAGSWEIFENKEAALIQSTALLDGMFIWTGSATYPATQALCWPRTGMLNRHGYPIDPTIIPKEIKNAQCMLSFHLSETNIMAKDDVWDKDIRSVSAGPVSVSFGGKDKSKDYLGIYPSVSEFRNMPDDVRYLLVPSWYVWQDPQQVPFFEVIEFP